MDKDLARKILKHLDHNFSEYVVRDIGLLTATFLNKSLIKDISVHFWFVQKNGQAIVYRSGQDYNIFSKNLAEKCLKDDKFLLTITNELIKLTDELILFIKQNKNLSDLLDNWQDFHKMYFRFIYLHMAVYWPSVYLLSIKDKHVNRKKIDSIVKKLDKAYSYNEKLIPKMEDYFKNLGIRHLSCDELPYKIKAPFYRSTLQLGNKTIILDYPEAYKINKIIQEDYRKFLQNKKNINGLGVTKGVVTGKVKIVKDYKNFKNLKKGDILVTHQTRPQYNQYIKKVTAIVTDEGSLLGHSSIVAREFDIPCIVGTKNATAVLKNGDIVKVDANNGKVIKIS